MKKNQKNNSPKDIKGKINNLKIKNGAKKQNENSQRLKNGSKLILYFSILKIVFFLF
jgi:hypothetical protein